MLHPSHFFLPWKKGCKSLETGQLSWMSRERPRTSGTNLDILWATEQRQQLPTNHFKLSTFFYFTILYWFCHTSTWINHGCTRVPHPEPHSQPPPHPISLGHPSAPAPSILSHASNLDWRFISYMILYMFQCHSPKSSHTLPLPQSPKDCSRHLCLFCCLAYRVTVTIFLRAKYFSHIFKQQLIYHQGHSSPLQYSCLENPMDGGAW